MPKKTDPRFWQSPAYSLRGKIDFPINVSSPGPMYRVDQTTRHGRYTTAKVDIGIILDKSVCTHPLDKQINIAYIGTRKYYMLYTTSCRVQRTESGTRRLLAVLSEFETRAYSKVVVTPHRRRREKHWPFAQCIHVAGRTSIVDQE